MQRRNVTQIGSNVIVLKLLKQSESGNYHDDLFLDSNTVSIDVINTHFIEYFNFSKNNDKKSEGLR